MHKCVMKLSHIYLFNDRLFSEENKVPGWKLERWQGLPHINKVKLYVLSFKMSLCIQFCYSVNKESLFI